MRNFRQFYNTRFEYTKNENYDGATAFVLFLMYLAINWTYSTDNVYSDGNIGVENAHDRSVL
jgi:hypothetical protein